MNNYEEIAIYETITSTPACDILEKYNSNTYLEMSDVLYLCYRKPQETEADFYRVLHTLFPSEEILWRTHTFRRIDRYLNRVRGWDEVRVRDAEIHVCIRKYGISW